MRANPSASMQKTYDECFLTCSTAVYFEKQNNEAEALRSWKSALDQIYYHNAHRVPSNYRPKTQTEKALQESLHQLELQCKERVDLLEALRKSREEAPENATSPPSVPNDPSTPIPPPHHPPLGLNSNSEANWLGGGTIAPVGYSDLYRPPLPHRPSLPARKSSGNESSRVNSLTRQSSNGLSPSPQPTDQEKKSRTPSPEKKGRMLRTLRPGNRDGLKTSSSKLPASMRSRPPAAAKAATQAWGTNASPVSKRPPYAGTSASKESPDSSQPVASRTPFERPGLVSERPQVDTPNHESYLPRAPFHFRAGEASGTATYTVPPVEQRTNSSPSLELPPSYRKELPSSSAHKTTLDLEQGKANQLSNSGILPYRNEYPTIPPDVRLLASSAAARSWTDLGASKETTSSRNPGLTPYDASISNNNTARKPKPNASLTAEVASTVRADQDVRKPRPPPQNGKEKKATVRADLPPTPSSEAGDSNTSETESDVWKERVRGALKNLPRGVDKTAAEQILNEIVIQGDEVHWDDVAGLQVAKSALKETVVYPFLRPDLFMGLREPARGMLLFGPPGTGKTMLARAVATESRSTFFAISASSLTSKFLGESEKLVRALFSLAKMLAPSIIFVDEIDSLLSSRSGSGEHEATRRIKTEFLIQWSDLAKAAAGREQTEKDRERGDASRVLVLAATNLPWAIDEAARRRFVRRQYIPLPEDYVRKTQLKTLLSHQKHELNEADMDRLVELTEGFSGSDITALAKDAAMGPLRSLGEKLLHMTMEEIRPIQFKDFQASLQTIRPSVSKEGLKQFEHWAREFGERGG